MRTLVTLLLLWLASPAGALAQAAPGIDTVRAMLSGIEDRPSSDAWRALGDGTVGVLVTLYGREDEHAVVRIRAVWAARFYPTSASRGFLERVATSDATGLVVRTALESLAFAFGVSAVPNVAPLLGHADPAVREGAIRALGNLGGPDARRALGSHAAAEADAELRALTERTIAALPH